MKMTMHKKLKGFTLIELMSSMAITSFLVVIIVSLTSVGLNFWKSIREDIRAAQVSRPALVTMSQDMEGIQVRSGDSAEWLYAAKEPNFDRRSLLTGPDGAKMTNAAQVMFFSIAPDRMVSRDAEGNIVGQVSRNEYGDVNLIAYRLVYRDHILDNEATPDGLGFPVFALYRNLIPASTTFNGGEGGPPLLGQYNLQSAYSSREKNETTPSNFITENIIELSFVFEIEYEEGSGANTQRLTAMVPLLATSTQALNSCDEFRLTGNGINIRGGGFKPAIKTGSLSAIILSLTVISDEGMAYVDRLRKGGAKPIAPEEFFKRYGKSYTQRFPVPKPN